MRVLFITFEFGEHVLGGVGRVVNGLTSELRKALDLDVFHLGYSPKYLSVSAKHYRCNANSSTKLIATYPAQYVSNCIKLIKAEKYDLIHVFNSHWIIDKIISRVVQEAPEQKIVYSIHGIAKFEKGIRVNPVSSINCEEMLLEKAQTIHILNNSSYVNLSAVYGNILSEKAVSFIPNGINAADYEKEDAAFKKKIKAKVRGAELVVLCMSRWAQGKGIEYFLDAARILMKRGCNVKFILAGRRNVSWELKWDSYLKKIDDKTKKLGSNIIVLDWVNDVQRNTLFKICNAFVMPSELEYLPYSALEPLAAGLPLISSDLPCITEMFKDQNHCLFFQSRNSEDLACRIKELMENRESVQLDAKKASEKLLKEYDWSLIGEQYLSMYERAVEERNVELLKVI
jgi:glycosyltransferase involved in cell wall biosynthesis